MMDVAARRGFVLTSRSRPLTREDLRTQDLIVGMDAKNLRAVKAAAEYWAREDGAPELKELASSKLRLMSDYCASAHFP